jgi:ubiquinone/menaquinone biosynthesis C-methylase UbiE
MSEPFDATHPEHVALYDEMPLWSAQAGALLLDHVPLTARRALDVGCGAGFPLLELAERLGPGALTVGVDPWAQALSRAARKLAVWPVPQAALVRGDGAALAFREHAFDLVVSNLGVNNFANAEQALRECLRVLAPGGVLAISTNVMGHFAELYGALELLLRRRGDDAALARLRDHVAHRGSVESIAKHLEACGFRLQATHTRAVSWRFQSAQALFAHHFMRLGFADGWREIAGENADAVMTELGRELDATAARTGAITLTVPLVVMLAQA